MFVLIPVLQDTVVGVPPYPFTLQDPSDVRIAECWYARPDAHSCSSLAMCDPRTAGHQVGPTTPIAPMTSGLSWCSSAHLSRGFTQGLPNGASWSAKTLSAAFPHAHPLCGSLPARAGACPALPPVSGRQCDIYYPLQVPSAPTGQIRTWGHRFVQHSRQEGEESDEVNWWLWQFGRGKPRLAGLSVADT